MGRIFIHPGWVISRTDGDRHFISFPKLCQLYKVNPSTAINAQLGLKSYKPEPGDAHYYPRADGKYPMFEEDDNGN